MLPATTNTIVIGAGQAGLAAGYYLSKNGIDFIIVDAHWSVGDNWRTRWDSLRLFTPAKFSSLPGMPFPKDDWHLPAKDEMADYLEAYARRFDLPIRMNTRVESVAGSEDGFRVETTAGPVEAVNVIVATGAFHRPNIPPFADDLAPGIFQAHSSAYSNPDTLRAGDVLVVGAGNSGAQIAVELAESREVWLSGPDTGRLPRTILGRDLYWWIWPTLLRLSTATRIGRKFKKKALWSGDPLIGMDADAFERDNLHRVERTVGVEDGKPRLADGTTLDVANVVWCTGFRPDFSWIQLPVFEEDGYPLHDRGVASGVSGLYFLGLRFLHRFRSSLIGGVAEDAEHVVRHICSRGDAPA